LSLGVQRSSLMPLQLSCLWWVLQFVLLLLVLLTLLELLLVITIAGCSALQLPPLGSGAWHGDAQHPKLEQAARAVVAHAKHAHEAAHVGGCSAAGGYFCSVVCVP
jgi:hypothetical protein